MSAAPKAPPTPGVRKTQRRQRAIAASLAVVVVAAAVIVAVLASGSVTPKKKSHSQETVLLRNAVTQAFIREHAEFKTLVAASKSCTTTNCFDSSVRAFDSQLGADQNLLTVLNFPVRSQHALGEFVHVISAIRAALTAVLARTTLIDQLKVFNSDLVSKGHIPLALSALANKAIALNISLIT